MASPAKILNFIFFSFLFLTILKSNMSTKAVAVSTFQEFAGKDASVSLHGCMYGVPEK